MSQPMSEEGKKKNLMLTVDEDVIEKAKKLRLNISDITEKVLRGFAFAPDQLERETVYAKYEELLKVMEPLLKQYDVSVPVGEWIESPETFGWDNRFRIYWYWTGMFSTDAESLSYRNIREIELRDLYEPKKILANFITTISEARDKNEEKIKEIEMVKRVILAFTEDLKRPTGHRADSESKENVKTSDPGSRLDRRHRGR
jgi:hypothetical protein